MPRFLLTLVALAALVPIVDGVAAEEAAEATAKPAASPLAGKTFTVEITTGGEKAEDVLTFEGNTLISKSYAESRFAPAPCTATSTGDSITFTATMTSPRGAEALWEGTVTGTTISGSVTTSLKGQRERSTFTGK
ncbi:MAG: hypothetical protein H0W72_12730 [Planctomycetes bacterium]|nr:hypothetical protein [Planctomycetota bacterium]